LTATASVLIYSMGEVIGDGLIKLPFIASLKDAFPGASIHWCAAKGSTVYNGALKPIVEGLIDEVIDGGVTGVRVSDLLLLREPFAGRRFDVVIDTQTNVRRTLVIKRARAQGGVFVSPAADFRFSDIKRKAPWPEAMVDRLQTLASLATGRRIEARSVALTDRRALAAATALLPDGPRYIGFAPGAGGVVKRWPLDRYIALAAGQEGASRTPVFFLGPDEVEMADRVRAALPKAIFPELGRTDAFQDVRGPLLVVALASRLGAAVANDAGPGHMLAAGGAPLLSLQRDRRRAIKFHPAARRLKLLIAADFPGGAGLDMGAISLEEAERALNALVADTP
jgi:ADP-heptose:LPS heptosyltransferase